MERLGHNYSRNVISGKKHKRKYYFPKNSIFGMLTRNNLRKNIRGFRLMMRDAFIIFLHCLKTSYFYLINF